MSLVGVCHFDDPKSATSGWASINGGKAFRVSNRGELQSNVFWVTNLMWKAYREFNLVKVQHIQDAQFFRTSYTLLGIEYGFVNQPQEQAEFFSKIFTNIANYCGEKLKIDISTTSYRLTTLLRDYLMPNSFRKTPDSPFSLDINNAVKQSTQQLQIMTGKSPQGSKTHNFMFPRGSYSRWLLSMKYPMGNKWEKLPEKDYTAIFGHEDNIQIKGSKTVLSKLKDLHENKAAFLKISIISQSPEYINFQTFGSGSSYPRRWATLPEVIFLSRFSKIQIEGGYATDAGDLRLNTPLRYDDIEFSVARSIFLESVSMGLSTPYKDQTTEYTALGAYLRAYDRIACAKTAERLNRDAGFTIGSFGAGRVTAYLRPNEIETANKIALDNGLLPSIVNLISGDEHAF